MSRLGHDLRECCESLVSKKKTERRKRLDELKILLEEQTTLEYLTQNSDKNKGVTWTDVFPALHDCLLKEVDAFREENAKGKLLPSTDKAIRSCCGLLVHVVTTANKGKPRLPCQDIFSCILCICEADEIILNSIIGDTYINLLGLALSSEKYWGEISFQIWKGLPSLCIELLQKITSDKMKAIIISVFDVILLQGGRLSPLIIKSKNLLVIFPEILKTLINSRYPLVQSNTLHICHTICVKFGKEFRLSVNDFIDKVLPHIMTLSDNRTSDVQFKEMMAQLLIEMVSIRSADGNCFEEASSLLNFTEKELTDISRHKLSLPPLPKVVILAVKLLKQVHQEKVREDSDNPAPKRVKITSDVCRIIDNINSHNQFPWPWLCYLNHLLSQAPEVLTDEDILSLFRHFTDTLPSTNDPLSLQFLIKSSVQLLHIYKRNYSSMYEKYFQDLLAVLSATLIRCVTTPTLSEIGLELSISLFPDWLSSESSKTLIDLFIDQKIQVTKTSLTAVSYISSGGLVESSTEKVQLIRWCLSGEHYSAKALFNIILKTKLPVPSTSSQLDVFHSDSELFYAVALLEYVTDTQKDVPLEVGEDPSRVLIEDKTACDALVNCIIDRLSEVNSIVALLRFTSCLCSLQSLFIKHNMSVKNKINEILDRSLSGTLLRLEECLQTPDSLRNIIDDVCDFFRHFSELKKPEVAGKMQNLMVALLSILKIQLKNSYDNKDTPSILKITESESNGVKPKEVLELKILSAVLLLLKGFSDKEKIQAYVTLLQFCLNELSLSSHSGFTIATNIIEDIINSRIVTKVLLKDIVSIEMKLSKRWYHNCIGTCRILDVLCATLKPLFLQDDEGEIKPQIYLLVSSFSKQVESKKYGAEIIVKFVNLLAHLLEVDPNSQVMIDTSKGRRTLLLYFVDFLSSPFHEVRIRTSEYLEKLFSSKMCSYNREDQSDAFKQALLAVDNLFIVKEGKNPNDVKEEGFNRSSCALKILLGLVCSSCLWRRKALYHLFKIISIKNISHTLFEKVHNYIEKSLKLENVTSFLEQNLDYILWSWYQEFKSFEKFPYHFMNHNDLPSFLSEYRTVIVPILLENLDMEGMDSFCNAIKKSRLDVAISCFPEIIGCLLPKLGETELKHAKEIHVFILELIDQGTLKKLLSSEVHKVLLAVFMKLNDSAHLAQLCGPTDLHLPTPTPLNVNVDGVNAALKYMQRTSANSDQLILVLLCNEFPHDIQFIMHGLQANISIANTREIRCYCFHQYIALCEALVNELKNIKEMGGFIIWHLTHALLNLLQTDLATPAINYLYKIVKKCFPDHHKYVDYLLDSLLPSITALSLHDNEQGQMACKIKEFLASKKELQRILAYLPLEETTANLEEEVKIFVQRQTPDLAALDRLSIQLTMRPDELNHLYDQVKSTQCFSEDCSRSLIHRLISKLISLATSSDSSISECAARCLGNIGPKNLNTLALQPESSTLPPPLAEQLISLLLPLIVHSDSEVSEAASIVAKELLSTDEGFRALGKLRSIERTFFTPFHLHSGERRKSIPISFSSDKLAWASCLKIMGGRSDGWAVWSGSDHSEWVRSVVSRLLESFDDGLLKLLAPLAAKQVEISEELLPYVVDILIESGETHVEGLEVVQNNLTYFFKKHFELRNKGNKTEENSLIYLNRKSVQCMISIVNYFRLKTMDSTENQRLNNWKKLNVNLLHVAYAAQYCRAYFTSLLYAELWVETIKSDTHANQVFNKSQLDLICIASPEDGQVLLNLLWEDYKELGERDSIEGCAQLQLGDPTSRLLYFREMGLWQQVIAEAEIENNREALSHGLLMSGLFCCASQMNNGSWDAAWRLGSWDIEQPATGNESFSFNHYSALKSALHLKDVETAVTFLKSARSLVLRDLAHASLEVASSIYSPLAKLQLITELESWCNGDSFCRNEPDSEWAYIEPILWQRGLLSADPQIWLSTARIARANSSNLVAQRLLQNIKGMEITEDFLVETKTEEALTHWESGNLEIAKYLLKSLLNDVNNPLLKGKCLLTYGTWMSESKSEGPKAIIENYFEEAGKLLESADVERLAAAECLAKFADSEYQRIHRYLESPEYDMKKSQMDAFRKNFEAFRRNAESCSRSEINQDEMKCQKIHQCNIEIDEAEMEAVRKEHSYFLRLAVREYLFTLQFDKTTSDRMFRFVSLWLANNKNSGLRKEVDKLLGSVPSHRFIPVFPQLGVRLSPETDHFAVTLRNLLYRCSEDHPYHCLWHLLALANAEVDQPKSDTPPQPRVVGAKKLVSELSKSKKIGKIVQGMQELALAYISFANYPVDKGPKPGDYKVPKNESIRQFKDNSFVSCATLNVPVNKNGDYSNVPGIRCFDGIYGLVGGINSPKKVKCLCTDGLERVELIKGQDDPRQDALMQQVFSVLNNLLKGDKNTASRKLSVLTYKVVPLTQKSGVIEWCQNTEPLAYYLLRAHPRHRPGDLMPNDCRNLLANVAAASPKEKLKVFLKICSEFKPVMRHFFFERFPTSGVWYERKLAYTRSVATNSMIGYVMGIGDRHVMNILINTETAELVHIDFGISFELAKILPTPETVPFRLTRDIEDGMGITGVEGVFRRCCEETMKVLRKRSAPILTTLEMLLYDPLYSWSVKPRSDLSQQSIPDISAAETNKLAERFLQRLKLKLEGREEGEMSSVESQVRNLIQEARDPKNLCRLFRGWQPYL